MTTVGIAKIVMVAMGVKDLSLLGENIEIRKEKNNE